MQSRRKSSGMPFCSPSGTLLFTGLSQDGSQQSGRGNAAFGILKHKPPVNVREWQGTPQMREQRHGFPDAEEGRDHACD